MRGKLFYFSRFFVRLFIGHWTADVPARKKPAVYVCSHNDLGCRRICQRADAVYVRNPGLPGVCADWGYL